METYDFGNNTLDYYLEYYFKYNNKTFQWIVTNYNTGEYEGSGLAVAFDGTDLYECSLGHCSCNGPLDDGFSKVCSAEEFLSYSGRSIFDEDWTDQMRQKIKELLT